MNEEEYIAERQRLEHMYIAITDPERALWVSNALTALELRRCGDALLDIRDDFTKVMGEAEDMCEAIVASVSDGRVAGSPMLVLELRRCGDALREIRDGIAQGLSMTSRSTGNGEPRC